MLAGARVAAQAGMMAAAAHAGMAGAAGSSRLTQAACCLDVSAQIGCAGVFSRVAGIAFEALAMREAVAVRKLHAAQCK